MSIKQYIKETNAELMIVKWPTRRETIFYTIVVIILSGVLAYFLGLFDFLFTQGLVKLLP